MDKCLLLILTILLFGLLTIHCYNKYENFRTDRGYVEIKSPFGRLGNNVKQLLNAMVVCKEKGFKLKLGSHFQRNINWVFDINQMIDKFNNTIVWTRKTKPNLWIEHNFYFVESVIGRVPNSRDHFPLSEQFLIPYVKLKLSPKPPNHLYIHIRSGDIFKPQGQSVNPEYVQPPLAFYTKIINETDYSKIIIVTESDRVNPVISKLDSLKLNNKTIEVQSGSIESDFKTLLEARNVVIANSTLSGVSLYLNKFLNNSYSLIDLSEKGNALRMYWYPKRFNAHRYKLKSYYPEIRTTRGDNGDWKNTPEQLQLMIDFPESKIEKE
jgi:hypothetical protein